jgi:hypothetical protein
VISGSPTGAVVQASYTITASNSSGSTTATLQITVNAAVVPPTMLVYPQTSITATVGQAITTDTPSVTGTVTAYSVAPALPAGLVLSTTTGAISGTPTAAAAQATYTVTATNSAGNATAPLQILVNPAVPAPSNLTYPQTTINAVTGLAITTDIPTVTGAVSSFSVSPALPAGLSVNTSNGAISGTPTAVAAQATYTVTAANATGSTTAALVITANQAPTTLLDLGHASQILKLKSTSSRLLSQDYSGHWVLWDDTTSAELASGDQVFVQTRPKWTVDLAGPTVAIGLTNGLELRSSSDGHLEATIVSPMIDAPQGNTWWKLASDGTYVCAGSANGLSIWNTAGQLVLSRQGNYSAAQAFAGTGQVQIALGAAGPNVIETISTTSGTSSVGPAFSGTFNSWFFDGQRFLTDLGTTVWTYSAASVQQSIVSLPSVQNLSGSGNWVYTYGSATLTIYPVGGSTPSATFNIPVSSVIVGPGENTLGILANGVSISVVDLSGSTPIKTDYALPVTSGFAYTANSASQWTIGNQYGVILDGASLSTGARYFGSGQAWSIAGSSNFFAIATAVGTISYYTTATSTPMGTINFSSSRLALSSDGSVMAALANTIDYSLILDRTLKIFSLPSASLINSFPSQVAPNTPYFIDFTLSANGNTIGQLVETDSNTGGGGFVRQIVPATGGSVIWSGPSISYPYQGYIVPQVSPDGSMFAVSSGPGSATSIFTGNQVVTAVPASVVGWIDSNSILGDLFAIQHNTLVYTGSAIYDKTGSLLSNPALPQLSNLLPVSSNSIYSPQLNTIFSLTTGSPIWTSPLPSTGVGAIAGNQVIFASGSRIVTSSY